MLNRNQLTDMVCAKCGSARDREGQSYCTECHAEYQRERRRRHVSIPEDLLTEEQRAYLNRKRQGRRRVSREITRQNEAVAS